MSNIPVQDDNEAAPGIIHSRDLVVEDGEWEQDYNFLDYDFGAHNYRARAYLDEQGTVILYRTDAEGEALSPPEDVASVPAPVLSYLQYRFDRIVVLADGPRKTLWSRA